MRKASQKGLALFEIIIISVVAVVALAGWNIYQRNQNNKSSSQTVSSTPTTLKVVPSAPEVTSASDLDKASKTLDETQVDSNSDTVDLDKELSSF